MIRARPVSWLYVPGDRPDRFDKALASGAHVVIVDLEDAVVAEHKAQARRNALSLLEAAPPGGVEVRVNDVRTDWGREDLAAIADRPALRAIRMPKVQSAEDVARAVAQLCAQSVPLTCLLESALGVENAYSIATSPRVGAIGLGEADLAGDLGTSDEAGLSWPRSRVIVAARAAGLSAPAQSAFTDVTDLDGLARSCVAGRALGFGGRAAVHPRQLAVIHDAYRPSDTEVRAAQEVLAGLAEARADGRGVVALPDGRMVDEAMRRRAEEVLALATALNAS